jgi:hypothetical protein
VAQAIEIKRGKVAGVRFEGSGTIGCTHVICGMGADRVVELLDGDKPPKRLAEAATLKPAAWRYLLHLVAPLDALPDALGRLAFAVRDPNGDLDGGNALALHLADGYGQHAVLSVEAFASSPDKLGPLRKAIREHVDALMPYLGEHLLLVHSPHDGVAPEGDEKIEGMPLRIDMEPVWSMPGEHALGICGLPHATGIKHLLLASRQVLPGLGLEGELTAGWGAARLVLQTERKRDLVKGEVLHGS